jgi:hypothetical protein
MSDTLAIRPGTPAATREREELPAFLNWLACWIVLPNLPFLPITLLGGPPRYAEILACGCVGLIARRLPYWGRLAAFLALLTYLVLTFIAHMFNLHVKMVFSVIGLVADISPAVSPEYVAAAVMLALTCMAAAWLLRQRSEFSSPRWLLCGVGAALSLAAADYAISRDTMGSYARLAPAGAAFSSASEQTRFLTLADGKTNLMIVMVEAMGQPRTPELRERFDRIWLRPELADRFEIRQGQTAFYGSTTSGEVRELCGRWGDYPEIVAADPRCLPAALAQQGYRTSAVHAFTPGFFDRTRWYPLIGFQRMLFGEELMAQGARFCPNVFPGACDRDVPRIIAEELAASRTPQFVYWLTLNSHLPVLENRELGTQDCRELGPELDGDLPMICRLFALWGSTADALVEAVSRPDFPPTHILIVGDHMPPFTEQKSRLQFDPEHVPWILLRHKGADAAQPRG